MHGGDIMNDNDNDAVVDNDDIDHDDDQQDNNGVAMMLQRRHRGNNHFNNNNKRSAHERFLTYSTVSMSSFLIMIYWAFYTREQFYVAVVYLASSKLAHVIIGNFLIFCTMSAFLSITRIFLNGLRSTEQEAISDGLRWSLMETALAMTLFREEVSRYLVFWFLGLALAKCLHWAVEYRGQHMQQTDAVFTNPDPLHEDPQIQLQQQQQQQTARSGFRRRHFGFLSLLSSLLLLDLLAVVHCATTISKFGPSVHILFGFEAAILLVSSTSTMTSYALHVVDYFMHYSKGKPWHGKSTISFAFEVAFEACKFIFYLCFFTIIFTYYGLPINLIRDVWVSYVNLKRKVESFHKYRQLTFNMNEQFDNASEEDLVSCGHTCIICRDHMDKGKKLSCGHVFHFFCLREWLQQQQTCPTCRAEIPTKSSKKERQRWQWALRRQIAPPPPQEVVEAPQAMEDSATSTGDRPQSVEEVKTKKVSVAAITTAIDADNDMQKQKVQAPPDNIKGDEEDIDSDEDDDKHDDVSPFPCFYRVINSSGAKVYTIATTEPIIKLARTVPPNKLILCLEIKWFSEAKIRKLEEQEPLLSDSSSKGLEMMVNNLSGKMILRMPDGWVSESDLERVPIPLNKVLESLPVRAPPSDD